MRSGATPATAVPSSRPSGLRPAAPFSDAKITAEPPSTTAWVLPLVASPVS